MIFRGLHETVIKDVIDTIKDGIDQADAAGFALKKNRLSSASSLSKATEGLVLIFPHLCSTSCSIETASMLTKAIETKAVSLLQIAFSAFNITNSQDAVSFVRQFHTNVGSGRMSVDKFMDAMDSVSTESATGMIDGVDRTLVKRVLEEFSQMECYFEEDLNETSINDYKVVNRFGNYYVTEARDDVNRDVRDHTPGANVAKNLIDRNIQNDRQQYGDDWERVRDEYQRRSERDEDREFQNFRDTNSRAHDLNRDAARRRNELEDREHDDNYKRERDRIKDRYDQDTLANKRREVDNKAFKDDFDMIRQQILPSDVKKANEMVPTIMIINFITRDEKLQTPIRSQAVIGVKAKLYPATPDDVINKIIVKNADNNVFLKLMRVSTREISFVRDFLLAIDDAKLTAMSCSIKGSDTNKMLKTLERRALKGKIRKALNMKNSYKAITTLTITREEADFIKRYNNIDVFNANVARKLMESLNFMMFIIADDTEECAHILMDSGDDTFEKISYTHLERDNSDGGLKKAINLMTKIR